MKNIFKNISDKERLKLLDFLESHKINLKKDIDISMSVNDSRSICIVIYGYLQIIKTDFNGNRIIIEELTENSIFGGAISNIKNNEYSVITKEDSSIIVLDYNLIINKEDNKLPYYNKFIKNLLEILIDKIEANNKRIEILTNKTIRDRLLSYFNSMSKGVNTRTIYLPFNFTDLADYLAVNRSAMSREIGNLKDEGIIEVQGKKIKLLYYLED